MGLREIPGLNGEYAATSDGAIVAMATGRILREQVERGYRRVYLSRRKYRYVHRLVALAFHGPAPTPRHEVCHGDGNRSNNRPDNLRWGTRSDNCQDTAKHGRVYSQHDPLRGESCSFAVLCAADVSKIRAMAAAGEKSKDLAAHFSISVDNIRRIIRRDTWRHIA